MVGQTMKRTFELILAFFLFMMLVMFLSACSSTNEIVEDVPDAVCSSIVDAKCVRCHYKTRICDALGKKNVRQWKKSVNFMIKQGAQLSEDEQRKVVACLSSMPEGSDIVCK